MYEFVRGRSTTDLTRECEASLCLSPDAEAAEIRANRLEMQ